MRVGAAYPNGDLANTRNAGGPIDAATVGQLRSAWKLPLTAKSLYGSYSAAPVISDGVVYSQDLASNVEAISLRTGRVLWARRYEAPDQGPNGVAVAAGRVYGATSTTSFALDARTGRQLWSAKLTENS
ncbi:MAG TPA: PQQ-binding-like beta-propeller repeat protein, partial [Solirubrobacteraceae bacterium]|nr:PQQ-binding-like beta-propeller repeat protein [Solirubrobacteraceae bacterium]